jgi:hypothetical protein
LSARDAEGWSLPQSFEVGYVPANGSALPMRMRR